jgi:predicted RNA-binding Zn-ribbon protein involved in translation (DUF1610 family)
MNCSYFIDKNEYERRNARICPVCGSPMEYDWKMQEWICPGCGMREMK